MKKFISAILFMLFIALGISILVSACTISTAKCKAQAMNDAQIRQCLL